MRQHAMYQSVILFCQFSPTVCLCVHPMPVLCLNEWSQRHTFWRSGRGWGIVLVFWTLLTLQNSDLFAIANLKPCSLLLVGQLIAIVRQISCLSGLKANPADRSVFSPHVCNCWCTQWAEFHIRRPTGNFSWIMRLQNEQDLMSMFPDFALSDISSLFMPLPTDEDAEPSSAVDAGKLVVF